MIEDQKIRKGRGGGQMVRKECGDGLVNRVYKKITETNLNL